MSVSGSGSMAGTPKAPRKGSEPPKREPSLGTRVTSLLLRKGTANKPEPVDAATPPLVPASPSPEELPQLYLRVDQGRGFAASQRGFMYCTVSLEQLREQSNYVAGAAAPQFGDAFVLAVMQKMSCVEVTVYSVDEEGSETVYLGEVNVPIHTLPSHKLIRDWFPLESQRGAAGVAAQGELHITLFNSLQKSSHDAMRELEDVYAGLLQHLAANLGVLSSLFDAIDPSDADRISSSVVSLFNYLGKELELFQFVIRIEVDSTASMAVLFRSNSMAVRLVSTFAKLTAFPYLKWLLLPLIEETLAGDCARFEVDPTRLPNATPAQLKRNQQSLQDLVSRYVDAIIASVDRVPRKLRRVCSFFVELVEGKFPGGAPRAVGGLLFLRFLCPAIVAPAACGLLPKHPTGAAHRALVLVAKVLQNLANATQFKEPEMECFNAFLVIKQPQLTQFLTAVSTVTSSTPEGEQLVAARPTVVADSCVVVAKLLRQHAARIRAGAEEEDEHATHSSSMDELDRLLHELEINERVHDKPYNPMLVEAQLRKHGIAKLGGVDADADAASANSSGGAAEREGQDEDDEDDVLNVTRPWTKPMRPGAVRDMLTLALEIFMDVCANAKGKVPEWSKSSAHAEYKRFEAAVCELQKADMRQMLSLPSKVAFWLNVYHTLMLHVLFTVGAPTSAHAKRLFMANFRYRVGSFTLSLADIENGVLRGNVPNAKAGSRQWADSDKRRQLCLPKDVTVLCALANVHTGCSPVVVVYGAKVAEQLDAVLRHYLNAVVEIDVVKREVLLPKSFSRLQADLAANSSSSSSSMSNTTTNSSNSNSGAEGDSNQALLTWIYKHLVARKKLDLLYLQSRSCSVIVAKKGGKLMQPKALLAFYQSFEKQSQTVPDEVPAFLRDSGQQRTRMDSAPPQLLASSPAAMSPISSPTVERAKSSVFLVRSSSNPASPPPETLADEMLSPKKPPPSSKVVELPPARRLQRQQSVLDEDRMRSSLPAVVQIVTSALYDCQTLAQSIYADVCRTVSVTTAFNTGKIIREVKVTLLELPGVSWTAESLERFKQEFALEDPELTRLQRLHVSEQKQQQLMKLLGAIQTAVVDIRFLLENLVACLQADGKGAFDLFRVVMTVRDRLQRVADRVAEKNAEAAPLEELVSLEAAISPEIDALVSLLTLIKKNLGTYDLKDPQGRLSILEFAAILAWVKQQLDSAKPLPPFQRQEWNDAEVRALPEARLLEILKVLHALLDAVSRRLHSLRKRLLAEATREKLLDAAAIVRNCREALTGDHASK